MREKEGKMKMDMSKIFTVICCFILIVCLTLCISTLVVLRNSIAENEAVQNDALELVQNLDASLENMNQTLKEHDESISVSVDDDRPVIQLESFVIRQINGKIGVYTSDGILLRVLDISLDMLPRRDREMLTEGITVGSLKELMALIQDYTE